MSDIHTCHAGCPCHTGGTPAPDFEPRSPWEFLRHLADTYGSGAPALEDDDVPDDFRDPCSRCEGDGEVLFLHVPGDPQTEDSATCPDCHGTGLQEAEA